MTADIRWMTVDVLIKATLVLLLAMALVVAMPRASASRRRLMWLVALIAALFMPGLCAMLPAWRVLPAWGDNRQDLPASNGAIAKDLSLRGTDVSAPGAPQRDTAAPQSAADTSKPVPSALAGPLADAESRKSSLISFARINRGDVLLSIWLLGSSVLLGRLVVSGIALRQLCSRSKPSVHLDSIFSEISNELGIRRNICLRMSHEQFMPMTWGVLRPVVLLPAEAEDWPRGRVRMALLHELAHVKRWDALAQLIGQVACAVYWFHPLIWVGARGLRQEQERAADDQVVLAESCAADYATLLLEVAARRCRNGAAAPVAIAMARHAALKSRLVAILDSGRPRKSLPPAGVAAVVLAACAIVLPFASLRAQTPASSPTTKPATANHQQYVGRVLRPDGEPVSGAEVTRGLWGRDGTPEPPTVRTADDGSFVLPAAGDDPRYAESLVARAPGWLPTAVTAKVGKEVTIHLAAASSVRVVFLGPDDQPIVGLKVKPDRAMFIGLPPGLAFDDLRLLQYPQRWADDLARQTDSHGACVFDLPQSCNTSFRIEDERYAQPSHIQNLVQTGAQSHSPDVTLHLEAGGAIAGKVTYGDSGKPAVGIQVHVANSDRRNPQTYGLAFTNERGEYRIAQLREGDYFLRPAQQKDAECTAATVTNLHVAPATTLAGANIVLIKGAVVHGRVYESDTGKPYAKANVMDEDMASHTYCGTFTDAEGRYTLRIPPGRQGVYLAQAAPERYSAEEANGYRVHPIEVTDGHDVEFDIPLTSKPGKTVSGRVLDERDKPVIGVSVNAVCLEDRNAAMNERYLTTDANGHFEFRGVNGFMRLRVVDGDGGTLQPTDVNGGQNDIVLRVVPHVRTKITGTVLSTEGKPIPDAAITLSYKWGMLGTGGGAPSAITDVNGRFSLPGLSPGPEYSVHVVAREYIDRTVNLDFVSGAPTYDVRVVLGTIRGP